MDEEDFERTVRYFEDMADDSTARTYDITLYPEGADNPHSTRATAFPRTAQQHDFVLIPPETDMPPGIDSDAEAATQYFFKQADRLVQTISVVTAPKEGTATFEASSGLNTEICQALVDVLPAGAAEYPERERAIQGRLAQETVCNALGAAAQATFAGVSHDVYSRVIEENPQRDVWVNGKQHLVEIFTVSPEQYQDMNAVLN